jgi:hypothetical protein
VVHPFAHMNSNFAAALRQGGQGPSQGATPSPARSAFLEALRAETNSAEAAPPQDSLGTPAFGLPLGLTLEADEWNGAPPAGEPADGFARAGHASATPRFSSLPEAVKWPLGPYRQAPPEMGGEWWLVSPFTGEEPWLTQGTGGAEPPQAGPSQDIPEDFLAAFGSRPVRAPGISAEEHRVNVMRWEQDLKYFKQTGIPEGYAAEQVERAGDLFEAWGMGRPVFYEGRYGWQATFPALGQPRFETSVFAALEVSHLVVAGYQVRQSDRGEQAAQRHPFVPPQVFGEPPAGQQT